MNALSPRIRERLDAVVLAMKKCGAWDIERPADAAFTDMGAFGSRTMAFEQWLRWVFVPNVESLLASGGPWPTSSSVAVVAVREGDTSPSVASLVSPLSQFDSLFNPAPVPVPVPEPSPAAQASERSHVLLEQGDYDGALAAIEDAIAKDPAYPNAENFAGWILRSRPLPDHEAAILHFRRALVSHPSPEALCNLADSLVALGRESEAQGALERAAREGVSAAEAQNWLAWYFLGKKDFERGAMHGRQATSNAPGLGLAWGTLAANLDALGSEAEAYEAYLEGLAAGGMTNPGFARRRLLTLETAMRARGEAPPAPDPNGLAARRTARANEVGRAIMLEVIAMPGLATAALMGGERTLGKATPVPPGDVPTAWIGTVVAGRPFVYALVSDLSIQCSVDVLAHEEHHAPVLRSIQIRGADVGEASLAVAGWLRGGGDADPTSVTPLDVAVMLNEILTLAVATSGGFHSKTFADYYRPDLPAIAGVYEGSLGVTATARAEGGVRIDLPQEHIGANVGSIEVPSFARFMEVRSTIVESMERAIKARDAFVTRPFPVGRAARSVMQALRDAAFADPPARWECQVGRDDYPRGWPGAWIRLDDGRTERSVASFQEADDGVAIRIESGEPAVSVRSAEDLRSQLSAIVSRAKNLLLTAAPDVDEPAKTTAAG